MNAEQTCLESGAPQLCLHNRRAGSLVIFRALQLGDMLCAVPALRALRAALPTTCITLVGLPWAVQFAERFPDYIDDFVAFPGHHSLPEQPVRNDGVAAFYSAMRQQQFDLALQMHGSGEVTNVIVQSFGAKCVRVWLAGASHRPRRLLLSISGQRP